MAIWYLIRFMMAGNLIAFTFVIIISFEYNYLDRITRDRSSAFPKLFKLYTLSYNIKTRKQPPGKDLMYLHTM